MFWICYRTIEKKSNDNEKNNDDDDETKLMMSKDEKSSVEPSARSFNEISSDNVEVVLAETIPNHHAESSSLAKRKKVFKTFLLQHSMTFVSIYLQLFGHVSIQSPLNEEFRPFFLSICWWTLSRFIIVFWMSIVEEKRKKSNSIKQNIDVPVFTAASLLDRISVWVCLPSASSNSLSKLSGKAPCLKGLSNRKKNSIDKEIEEEFDRFYLNGMCVGVISSDIKPSDVNDRLSEYWESDCCCEFNGSWRFVLRKTKTKRKTSNGFAIWTYLFFSPRSIRIAVRFVGSCWKLINTIRSIENFRSFHIIAMCFEKLKKRRKTNHFDPIWNFSLFYFTISIV